MNQINPLVVICQRSSLTRLHQRVQLLNEKVPRKQFSRIINGETVLYERQPKAITGSVEATAERIIKDYISDYHRTLRNVGPAALESGLPSFLTCRTSLAKRRTISEKTAYNHLCKLREMGLITNYKFHGTRHAFEIWIDPTLLFQPERTYPQPVQNVSSTAENQPKKFDSILSQTANFTAYKVTVTHSNYETEKKADGNVHGNALLLEHGNEKHGNPEQQQPESPKNGQPTAVSNQSHSDPAPGGGCATADQPPINPRSAGQRAKARLTKANRESMNEKTRTDQQRHAILEGYLRSFWRYAQKMLYAGKVFNEYEEPLIMNAIRQGVYQNYQPVLTEKEWDTYQSDLYRQIDIAATYFERHPEKYPPAPYAQFREGAGYFDRENSRGFVRTRTWLQENQHNYKQNYVTQRINLAVRHLQHHRVGSAPKTLQHKSYIEAYRHLEHQLAQYGTNAQNRFHELVATIDTRKAKLTPGFTKNFKK